MRGEEGECAVKSEGGEEVREKGVKAREKVKGEPTFTQCLIHTTELRNLRNTEKII